MMATHDRFGIAYLFRSAEGGRDWQAAWDDGRPRRLTAVEPDPCDDQFEFRGRDAVLEIDGAGVAQITGGAPRLYVRDRARPRTWGDVEVTVYHRRGRERPGGPDVRNRQGVIAGARSNHHRYAADPCAARTYYGRVLYSGRIDVKKELYHGPDGEVYARPLPNAHTTARWDTPDGEFPRDAWVGFKFVVRNRPDRRAVRLQVFRDQTGGRDGGEWESLVDETDAGDWRVATLPTPCPCLPDDQILWTPGEAVFVRNDELKGAEYKWFSVREVG